MHDRRRRQRAEKTPAVPLRAEPWIEHRQDAAVAAMADEPAQPLLQREDFEPALAVLDMGRRQFPENAPIAVAFGVACYGRRRFEDAAAPQGSPWRGNPGLC